MTTVSVNSFTARMNEDAEPVVAVRKALLQPADPDDIDQRGLYQGEVKVNLT